MHWWYLIENLENIGGIEKEGEEGPDHMGQKGGPPFLSTALPISIKDVIFIDEFDNGYT